MKKYILYIIIFLNSLTFSQVDVYVYEEDGITPFDYRELSTGTRLTLIVSSDSNDYWNGGLFIGGDYRNLGTLSGRNYDANTRDYTGSHFPEAASSAKVTGWNDSLMSGFDMVTFYPVYGDFNEPDTQPGEWFIIDYEAEEAGDCNIGFYDYSNSWSEPLYNISFTQIPSRDFNDDNKVDFQDYAILASNWNRSDCADPNWCDGTDLDRDSNVDLLDLAGFIDFWLWPPLPAPPEELQEQESLSVSEPEIPLDANIIIRIVDINDNNEITLDVNETVILYLRLTTSEQGALDILDVDVLISDTNLGSIDNREYYPVDDQNILGDGTARILAQPRDPFFDYVGPSYEQLEGITLIAVNIEADINDGNLASFEFTCRGPGDVTLSLKNYLADIYPKLQNILIHQIESNPELVTTNAITEEEQTDTEELIDWLEQLADDPNFSESMTQDEWTEFIETVENTE